MLQVLGSISDLNPTEEAPPVSPFDPKSGDPKA